VSVKQLLTVPSSWHGVGLLDAPGVRRRVLAFIKAG
jgi:hypothetical protein